MVVASPRLTFHSVRCSHPRLPSFSRFSMRSRSRRSAAEHESRRPAAHHKVRGTKEQPRPERRLPFFDQHVACSSTLAQRPNNLSSWCITVLAPLLCDYRHGRDQVFGKLPERNILSREPASLLLPFSARLPSRVYLVFCHSNGIADDEKSFH